MTPKSIKTLIIITSGISLLSPLFSFLMSYFFHIDASHFLALSLHSWKWQWLTYIFVQSVGSHLSLSLFFSLFFLMLLLWFAGKELVFRFGPARFLVLYLGSGVFSGWVALAYLYLANDPTLIVGSTSAIFATLIAWVLLYKDLTLYYFFILRLKAKILVAILFALPLLIHLISGSFALFFNELAGICAGYLFSKFFFKPNNI